jgi:2-keto-4-pentenoate hydratase/2-oxohepta-3-ene-1,7-dioic acid hydratase in catechol pathway
MRLATVDIGGVETCVAALRDGRALDLAAAQPGIGVVQGGRSVLSLQALIDGGAAALAAVRGVVAAAEAGAHAHAIHPSASLAFRAPIPVPRKNVFCVGRNYAEHIAEGARAQKTTINVTEVPVFFTKPPTSVVGHEAPVPIFPRVSTKIDYEVELALIIGTRGRDIAPADAYRHIFGYTILNDVSARDVQRRHGGQFFKGKALDGSCPMGPWVVTADEIEDPMALRMQLWVNGELRQNETTAAMIFDIPALIASLSEGLTLEPGDILATGTPSGVGYAMDPPHYLQDGDEMVCEIEGIGRLSNTLHAV